MQVGDFRTQLKHGEMGVNLIYEVKKGQRVYFDKKKVLSLPDHHHHHDMVNRQIL